MRSLRLLLCLGTFAMAGAGEDWEKIVALDAGPGVQPKSATEAMAISLAHTEKQEKALRNFLAKYGGDERGFETRLRLARLVALRADLRGEPSPPETERLIADAEKLATPEQVVEVDFARIALRMRQWRGKRPSQEERLSLMETARGFERAHPKDRRVGPLLVEVATLFDGDVKTKEQLLLDAKKRTKDPDVQAQIADDMKRLAWIGKQLPLRFTGLDQARVDVKDWRGKPVVVVFFATWSEPSCAIFKEMRKLAETQGAGFVAVSLDTELAELRKFLSAEGPLPAVACDGKSWDGPVVQALGINALPSVWLLDKQGLVRTLDPLDAPEELLRKLR